jgi:hypothetical protein
MPRYFFHLRSQDTRIEDTEGMDLPDLNAALAARDEAARSDSIERRGRTGVRLWRWVGRGIVRAT